MKFFLVLSFIPFAFTACFGMSGDPADEKTDEGPPKETQEETSSEESQTPPEIRPIDVTGPAFISNFFNGSYEYRTVTVHSSYDYMVDTLGEPSGKGNIIDGTYYHYDHIGFNFPTAVEDSGDTEELKVDGIIIFPDEFYKSDAVENFGWPTRDETSDFRMIYDSDKDNGYYVMMNYTQEDRISEIIIQFKDLSETDFYED